MKRIYLDYAATTPVDPVVLRAMRPYFTEKYGNAGSVHSFGQEAIAALDHSRETLAAAIGAEFREIVFTGSATEANNLALRGVVQRFRIQDSKSKNNSFLHHGSRISNPEIIISAIEHESILETARDLERQGIRVTFVPVDKRGFVDVKKIKESLTSKTILVSVMYANNEIGTVQPIAEIAKIIKDFKDEKSMKDGFPLFHTDASQAFQFFDCNVDTLGVDMMTLSAHKIYGPKGAGALYMKKDSGFGIRDSRRNGALLIPESLSTSHSPVASVMTGGGQEFGLRSGTENIPAIVGFAKAIELSANSRELAGENVGKLRNELWRGIKKIVPRAEVNGALLLGSLRAHRPSCLPNILNVYFPGHTAEDLLTRLDLAGIAASSGSACHSRAFEASYVVEALGYAKNRSKESFRFSLGRPTTKQEILAVLGVLKKIVK